MPSDFAIYQPIAEAIGILLFPHAEVVIHDFKTKAIGYLFNNMSKRKIGDPSLVDEMESLAATQELFEPYFKVNWDGRKMKAVSVVLKNSAKKPIGLLCINLDVSHMQQMHHFILDFIESKIAHPEALFKTDWREKINVYVTTYLKERLLCLDTLTRAEKRNLLLALLKEGAFETKNAAGYIADVLHISRATVYNYLKENKEKS